MALKDFAVVVSNKIIIPQCKIDPVRARYLYALIAQSYSSSREHYSWVAAMLNQDQLEN